VLTQIDDAGSAVLANSGPFTQLTNGEVLKCLPDTVLRLLAWGYLSSDGMARFTPTGPGRAAAARYRGSQGIPARECGMTRSFAKTHAARMAAKDRIIARRGP
jgi:hypothetical protein